MSEIKKLQIKKLRRRIEDYLRKCDNINKLISIAEFLGIHIQNDLKKKD